MKNTKIIDVIVGARPNFMKAAALFAVCKEFPDLTLRLVHTGQHYDINMSDIFLEQLSIPSPDVHLEVGSGSHSYQVAEIMKRYEKWVASNPPNLCLVVGDVNSTAACALVSTKAGIPVGHIEAGLRSFDRTMPEEINRIVTDSISSLHFVTEESGIQNLLKEGHSSDHIYHVGNVMIDTLLRMKKKADNLEIYKQYNLKPKNYSFLTLHRPSNVDDPKTLKNVCEQLLWGAEQIPTIFAVHPRTRKALSDSDLDQKLENSDHVHLTEPLGYLESLSVWSNAKAVITDSGGLQEETTALNIPCLTLRDNTERPITIEKGTNTLINRDWELFHKCIEQISSGTYPKNQSDIPLWDGKSGSRILKICQDYLT